MRVEQIGKGSDRDTCHIEDLSTHPEPYVTVSQLARYWRVSAKHVHKQIKLGLLGGVRLGPRTLRIGTAEAIRFERMVKTSSLGMLKETIGEEE